MDLSGANLAGWKLNRANLLRANLTDALLANAQLEHAHLSKADLSRAVIDRANLEHVNARDAIFDNVSATDVNFEVSTLRGASFKNAQLYRARFHRAYLRDANLRGANLTAAWMQFATFDGACCQKTTFTRADLRNASMVETDLRGADLTDVQVYGISAWKLITDAHTLQDLVVGKPKTPGSAPLRAPDLHTAQLLALMLDGTGIRHVFDAVSSKLVLILGSFAPTEKPVLDALRITLQERGYVAVTFDFERPYDRDYSETMVILAGLSRFIVADLTNAKEVRSEIVQARSQYRRIPIIPIAKKAASLPITMANSFTEEDLQLLVRYETIDDLLQNIEARVINPAEARARLIAENIAKVEHILRKS